VALIELFIITLFAGTKSGPVIMLVNFLVAYHIVVKPIRTHMAYIGMIAGMVLVVPFYAVKARVRENALSVRSQAGSDLTVSDYLWLHKEAVSYTRSADTGELVIDTVSALVSRVDVVSTLAATIEHYDRDVAYDTRMYMELWIKPYVPRFLWPAKGWVGLGTFVSSEILGSSSYTHAAVNSTIEGYIAFGVIGAVVLSVINGAFVATSVLYYNSGKSKDDIYLAQYCAIYLFILYFNGSYTYWRYIATTVGFIWLIATFFKVVLLLPNFLEKGVGGRVNRQHS
jgi:hypothetical protein